MFKRFFETFLKLWKFSPIKRIVIKKPYKNNCRAEVLHIFIFSERNPQKPYENISFPAEVWQDQDFTKLVEFTSQTFVVFKK